MTNRFFLDTEFIEDGHTIELVSIAIVGEDGTEFYAENADVDLTRANPWVRKNVIPHLMGKTFPCFFPHREIGPMLIEWIAASETNLPEFWTYFGSYDWVAVAQLFGTMIDLPDYWPMFVMDIEQLRVMKGSPTLPARGSIEHNALNDAKWTREAYNFLVAL